MNDAPLSDTSERLATEFGDRLTRSEIRRAVSRAHDDIAGSVSDQALPEMVERLARERLARRADAVTDHADRVPAAEHRDAQA